MSARAGKGEISGRTATSVLSVLQQTTSKPLKADLAIEPPHRSAVYRHHTWGTHPAPPPPPPHTHAPVHPPQLTRVPDILTVSTAAAASIIPNITLPVGLGSLHKLHISGHQLLLKVWQRVEMHQDSCLQLVIWWDVITVFKVLVGLECEGNLAPGHVRCCAVLPLLQLILQVWDDPAEQQGQQHHQDCIQYAIAC